MFVARRGLVAALFVGVCVALTGCWEKESSPNEPAVETDPLALRKQVVAQERARALQNHHDRTVEAFVKTEGLGDYRMPMLRHRMKSESLALNLPGWAEEPSLDATG